MRSPHWRTRGAKQLQRGLSPSRTRCDGIQEHFDEVDALLTCVWPVDAPPIAWRAALLAMIRAQGSPDPLWICAQVAPAPRAPRLDLSIEDFDVVGHLGDGSYAEVVLARLRKTGQEVALKIMDKFLVMRSKKVDVSRAQGRPTGKDIGRG